LELLVLATQSFDLLLELINAPITLTDPLVSLRDLLFQVRDAPFLVFRPAHPASVYSCETVNSYACGAA